MTAQTHSLLPPGTPAIILSRMFSAPRRLVWAAFTDARQLPLWWGPDGFSNLTRRIDIRTGGEWIFTMRGPDGTEYPNRIRYIEVRKFERIAFLHDEGEKAGDHAFTTTITFEQRDTGTLVTMTSVFRDEKTRDRLAEWGAVEAGKQTLEKLAAHLATKH